MAATVLIADNDPGVQALLAEVARRAGCTVRTAADGLAARDQLRGGGVDVLVCDLDMPRLSGNDLLDWLARQPAPPATIVVSGFVDDRLRRTVAPWPWVRAVLRKPFDVMQFRDLVAQAARPPADGRAAAER